MNKIKRFRAGGWLPHDRRHIDNWVRGLKARVTKSPQPLVRPIQEFKDMVETDPVLNFTADTMFKEAALLRQHTPLGTPEVKDFNDFLGLLNGIMTQAPEYTECPDSTTGAEEPCGLIGFPINALLDWPMATGFGYDFFANALVNQQFKKILNFWSEFLVGEASRAVLVDSFPDRTPKVLAWLSSTARQEMVDVACQASEDPSCRQLPFEHFFNCDPSNKYYGFKSWDDFFTRTFVDGVRPVAPGEDEIANACESAPLQVVPNVSNSAAFWLKGQPYSLQNMMNFDPLAKQFIGGTVYQAFLSALSYHRWNSPVSGTVKKAFVVNGSYYLENRYQGFINPEGGDPSAPNDSQPFLTAVATRAVIFIEADNPKIGLMCFIAVGMAEVSSCEITVAEGQHLVKGDQLGMFHFGGSTHCLVFRPQVKLSFDFHNTSPGLNATNIPVRSRIATVVTWYAEGPDSIDMLVLADNENDSLPDNFEEKYGCLSPLKMNSAEDPDGNGIVDRKIEISAECTYLNKGDYHGQVMISSGADLWIVKVHMLVSDDVDGDWIFDLQDNCLFVPNQNQNDTDNDSYGNLCDTDLYNDNVAGLADLGVLAQDLGNSARSANQCTADFDLDGDGEGSRCADVKHRKKGE